MTDRATSRRRMKSFMDGAAFLWQGHFRIKIRTATVIGKGRIHALTAVATYDIDIRSGGTDATETLRAYKFKTVSRHEHHLPPQKRHPQAAKERKDRAVPDAQETGHILHNNSYNNCSNGKYQ